MERKWKTLIASKKLYNIRFLVEKKGGLSTINLIYIIVILYEIKKDIL